jgi:hypothetical protein
MARNVLWFFLGSVTATVFALTYLGRSSKEPAPASASAQARAPSSHGIATVSEGNESTPHAVESASSTEPTQRAPSDSNDLDRPGGSPWQALAASLQSTPEEVQQLAERSFDVLSASPDRLQRFENESRRQGERVLQLENIVVNELWRNVHANPPATVETECRPAGCRVELFFVTSEGLRAAAQSPLDLRMLFALQQYGFEAAESQVDFDLAEPEAGPEGPPRALDIYLWPKAQGSPQSLVSQSRLQR